MLTYKNSVAFRKGELPSVVLRNFFEPEDGFVWSTSTWSEVIFAFTDSPPSRGKSTDLMVDLDVFRHPPELLQQTVKVYLNGWRIGSRDVNDRITMLIPFDPTILKATENVLTFDTPDASVPEAFGVSDSRQLRVQLFSLQFRHGG